MWVYICVYAYKHVSLFHLSLTLCLLVSLSHYVYCVVCICCLGPLVSVKNADEFQEQREF